MTTVRLTAEQVRQAAAGRQAGPRRELAAPHGRAQLVADLGHQGHRLGPVDGHGQVDLLLPQGGLLNGAKVDVFSQATRLLW